MDENETDRIRERSKRSIQNQWTMMKKKNTIAQSVLRLWTLEIRNFFDMQQTPTSNCILYSFFPIYCLVSIPNYFLYKVKAAEIIPHFKM